MSYPLMDNEDHIQGGDSSEKFDEDDLGLTLAMIVLLALPLFHPSLNLFTRRRIHDGAQSGEQWGGGVD